MAEKTISALVDGGQASAGPPLGPALGPLGVNIGDVISTINQKTASFEGMTVPVDVIVDEDTREFRIEIGTPPASALIKKRAGIDKGSGTPNTEKVGDISIQDARDIAEMKFNDLNAGSIKTAAKEIIGSCHALGVTVDGKPAQKALRAIENGKYDNQLAEQEGDE